jgi:DNA-binding transcriptional regulator/RsmH inhibitor MraZ
VVLPKSTTDFVGIDRQVALTGARDHLVVWNRNDYTAFLREHWDRYPELLRSAQQSTSA